MKLSTPKVFFSIQNMKIFLNCHLVLRIAEYLRVKVRALLHQRAYCKPEGITQAELILHDVAILGAGMRVVPFIRREAGNDEHGDGYQHVCSQHVQPDLDCKWIHERE